MASPLYCEFRRPFLMLVTKSCSVVTLPEIFTVTFRDLAFDELSVAKLDSLAIVIDIN